MCTEEDESIDSMIKAFRARHSLTLNQLMEVDSMWKDYDPFEDNYDDFDDRQGNPFIDEEAEEE